MEFYNTHLAPKAPKRRKIASQIFTESTKDSDYSYLPHQLLSDFDKFKDSMFLFPYPAYAEDN